MKGNTETLNYVGIHVQNFLIAAHYNGATLAVSVGNDECGMITVNVASFVMHVPQLLLDQTFMHCGFSHFL